MTQAQQATSLTEKLNVLGEDHCIVRNLGEGNAEYAQRILYELDVHVEEVWAHQDKVRALLKSQSTNLQE
jgi:hypothetical protein